MPVSEFAALPESERRFLTFHSAVITHPMPAPGAPEIYAIEIGGRFFSGATLAQAVQTVRAFGAFADPPAPEVPGQVAQG